MPPRLVSDCRLAKPWRVTRKKTEKRPSTATQPASKQQNKVTFWEGLRPNKLTNFKGFHGLRLRQGLKGS